MNMIDTEDNDIDCEWKIVHHLKLVSKVNDVHPDVASYILNV